MTTATDWAGPVGEVWAAEWRRTDRTFAGLAPHLDAAILAAVAAGPFTAVDIGCGAGATSIALAHARPDARVTGIDLSPGLVTVACERAANLPNAAFAAGDAVTEASAIRPDVLFSRHGVMFFTDPRSAFAGLRRAVAPGAPLVFSCFAAVADNSWATLAADLPPAAPGYAPGPFAFADAAFVQSLLDHTGWHAAEPRLVRFGYRAGEGDDPVADALSLLARIGPAARALRDAEPSRHQALLTRLRERLAAQRTGDVIDFPAAAWLWTARAA